MEEALAIYWLHDFILAYLKWSKTIFPYWPYITVFFVTILLVYIYYRNKKDDVTDRFPLTMRKVNNPFTFDISLQDMSSQDFKCTISTQRLCYILPFWGVDGFEFFPMLHMDWISLKYNLFEHYNTFKSKCLIASPIIRFPVGRRSLAFTPPSSLCLYEIIEHRPFFPLVIVMLLEDDTIKNIEEPTIYVQAVVVNVPAFYKIINIRNVQNIEPYVLRNMEKRTPSVLGIYVKESHLPTLGVIQRIFDGSLFSENLNGENIPICVACCQRTVNTISSPCLHASLCSLCYLQCKVCPNCRRPLLNYFITGPLTEIPQKKS